MRLIFTDTGEPVPGVKATTATLAGGARVIGRRVDLIDGVEWRVSILEPVAAARVRAMLPQSWGAWSGRMGSRPRPRWSRSFAAAVAEGREAHRLAVMRAIVEA